MVNFKCGEYTRKKAIQSVTRTSGSGEKKKDLPPPSSLVVEDLD